MATNPLTHHEILELVGPFSQRGLHVDLAASDRVARRLVFKPAADSSGTPPGPVGRQELALENPDRDRYRLIRTLTHGSGLAATVQMEGRYPSLLIEQVEAFPPARQFQVVDGIPVARNYRILPGPDVKPGGAAVFRTVLRTAQARLPHLDLHFDSQSGYRMPAEIRLMARPEHPLDPPDDLLAVLGWAWRPLRAIRNGWRGNLKLPRAEPRRTADGERKLARTVRHLADVLAQPPEGFHPRFHWARWRVVARKTLGLLVVLGALALGPAILMFDLPQGSILRMLAFNMPPFLLLALFMIPDLPQMRIPRLPRPLPGTAWEPAGTPGAAVPVPLPGASADPPTSPPSPEAVPPASSPASSPSRSPAPGPATRRLGALWSRVRGRVRSRTD